MTKDNYGIIYISGPMTGLPLFNYPEFNETAEVLRGMGHRVFNPAEADEGSTDRPREFYFRNDLAHMPQCSSILLLDGWESSEGAIVELLAAKQMGFKVLSMSNNYYGEPAIKDITDQVLPKLRVGLDAFIYWLGGTRRETTV